MQYRLTLANAYDYLDAGVEYVATVGKNDVRIWRADGASGTFLKIWQWRLLESGKAGAQIIPAI